MDTDLGKVVAGRTYFHTSTLPLLEASTNDLVSSAVALASISPDIDFNVIRIDPSDESIALLNYPGFFEEGCPQLHRSWKVELKNGRVAIRNYGDSLNPPILHRKELLLDHNDYRRPEYARLTAEFESLGLFEDSVRIGFKLPWERLLRARGFRLVGNQLVPIGNEDSLLDDIPYDKGSIEIARHLTALSRHNFSAPIQILRRFGFLDGSRTIFDYGCGKGDDLRGLIANSLSAAGWDPYYAPDEPVSPASIVNLGFVINVIEDPAERRDALERAFGLAEEMLIVSTMLATERFGRASLYSDGVLTSRSTFQKYYTQAELRDYLSATLKQEPIAVAPGVFFVFKDKQAEQRFQVGRYRSRLRIRPFLRPERPRRPAVVARKRGPAPDKYHLHRTLLDPLWMTCLDLGREPDAEEVANIQDIERALGSLKKALRLVLSRNDQAQLDRARRQRTDDLAVYFALQQFQGHKPYKQLESRLQKDVRAFFGDYTSAQEEARHILQQVAQPTVLDEACRTASEQGLGWLEPSHFLQLHTSVVPRLPVPLRVYVGCAGVLYGDPNEADLVKIHIRSGKISFMKYDDFLGSALPKLIERTKVNLRNLDLQVFVYGGEYPRPPLYLKSRYINEELPNYADQLEFDKSLKALQIVDLSGYGPSEQTFSEALQRARWTIEGLHLVRLHRISHLDEPCGKYLTYRQLIECGETQARTGIGNLPNNPESYTALLELATNILDPIIEYFGRIELTYGFCSLDLSKRIVGRIAPELDQHAAHERKRAGAAVCARGGAAVDFLVRDENMKDVADWIIANLAFDRLYYYGIDRPLHVSHGPEHKREATEMVPLKDGKRVPRPFGRDKAVT